MVKCGLRIADWKMNERNVVAEELVSIPHFAFRVE